MYALVNQILTEVDPLGFQGDQLSQFVDNHVRTLQRKKWWGGGRVLLQFVFYVGDNLAVEEVNRALGSVVSISSVRMLLERSVTSIIME